MNDSLTFYFILFSVDTISEETETSLKKIKDNTALLWRTLRIAVPFYLAVMILCSIGWLEPQCCDLQNNYKWSFALGLRYMNGPPPTWCVLCCKLVVQNQNATKFRVSSKLFLYIIVLLFVLLHMISVNDMYVKNVDGLGNHVSKELQHKVFLSHCLHQPSTHPQQNQHS